MLACEFDRRDLPPNIISQERQLNLSHVNSGRQNWEYSEINYQLRFGYSFFYLALNCVTDRSLQVGWPMNRSENINNNYGPNNTKVS